MSTGGKSVDDGSTVDTHNEFAVKDWVVKHVTEKPENMRTKTMTNLLGTVSASLYLPLFFQHLFIAFIYRFKT